MELDKTREVIKANFEISREAFQEKIDFLYSVPGFDADGLTDIHPEILDPSDHQGHVQLNRWTDLLKGISQKPARVIIARIETKETLFDSPRHMPVVDQAWLRFYEELKPDSFRFERATKTDPARIFIDSPSQLLTETGEITEVQSTAFEQGDIRFTMRFSQHEELELEPVIVFAQDADDIIDAVERIDKKYGVSGHGMTRVFHRNILSTKKTVN